MRHRRRLRWTAPAPEPGREADLDFGRFPVEVVVDASRGPAHARIRPAAPRRPTRRARASRSRGLASSTSSYPATARARRILPASKSRASSRLPRSSGFRQAGSQQQILVHPDRAADVALLPVQAREGVIGIEVGAVGFDDPLQPGLGTGSGPRPSARSARRSAASTEPALRGSDGGPSPPDRHGVTPAHLRRPRQA